MIGVLGLLLMSACSRGDETDEARRAVMRSLAEQVALSHYSDFEDRAQTMATATSSLCETPSPEALDAAQQAWWAAQEPWKRAEIIQFGPVIEYPDRLGPKLDDWPVNADAVEELIREEGALDQAAFDAMGSATRGLPVVEYLLWEGDDPLAALSKDSRRCAVLGGAASDVATNASRLVVVWRDDWIGRLSEPEASTDDAYDQVQDVVAEWVNRMAFTVENIRATKLGKPAGDSAGGEPQPDTIESRYSARSLTNASDALAGVQDVWTGDVGGDHQGVQDLLLADEALAVQLTELLAESQTRLGEIPETLEDTIILEPEIIARAQEALLATQVAIQVDLAQALAVSIAFNDNDGD